MKIYILIREIVLYYKIEINMSEAKGGLMAESKIDKLMGSLNSMGLCACDRGEKVIFVCTKKTCENF